MDEWNKENPIISPLPPPPTFARVNPIKVAIYSHPTFGSTMDLKPITSIPQLIPLDFSSRDPFGFDCWVHDVIHGFFWFKFNSLYIGFVCVVLPSIFYCWCCFLIFFFFWLRNKLTTKHTHACLITSSHQTQTHYFTQSTTTKKPNSCSRRVGL